jgi:hypothetical protein
MRGAMPSKFGSKKLFDLKSESGSLSVLISGLFLLVLTLSVGIMDISDSYLAKRELIQIGESALGPAAHAIDLARYYQSSTLVTGAKVPIDCALARRIIGNALNQARLRGSQIQINEWRCENEQMIITIQSKVAPIIKFPLLSFITGSGITVGATIGAGSIVK